MIEVKTEYPFIDINGVERFDLIKHYGEDDKTKIKYNIIQAETGVKYDEAIDVYPCRYHYVATDEPVQEEIEVEEVY